MKVGDRVLWRHRAVMKGTSAPVSKKSGPFSSQCIRYSVEGNIPASRSWHSYEHGTELVVLDTSEFAW